MHTIPPASSHLPEAHPSCLTEIARIARVDGRSIRFYRCHLFTVALCYLDAINALVNYYEIICFVEVLYMTASPTMVFDSQSH